MQLSGLGGLKALGVQVKELLLDRICFALLSFVDAGLGAIQGGLRRHHQPALGHAIVTQLDTLIAGRLIETVPGVPPERLGHHVRDELERIGNTRDKAELAEVSSIILMVQFGVCHQIPRLGER